MGQSLSSDSRIYDSDCPRRQWFPTPIRRSISSLAPLRPSRLAPSLAAALRSLFKPIEQAPGAGAREGLQPVRLTLLDAIACDRAIGTKDCGLRLHLAVPHVRIEFADIHENAHLRDRLKFCGAGSPHVSGESRNGHEILRIGCRDMKRRDPPVRRSRDVKLVVLNFVVRQNHLQKFREDAGALVKEQLTLRRRWGDNYIAALFSLGTEVAIKDVVHGVHGLRSATQSQNGRVRPGRIIGAWKDDLIMNG